MAYTPTTWSDGDVITAEKLNKLEQGVKNEQVGVRPVIVVSNNKANTYSSVITVVPLTSRIYKKRYLPTHVFISKYDMTGIRKGRLALAEQVMSISTKCIIEKCGRVNKWSLDRVLKAVRIQMGMEEKTT